MHSCPSNFAQGLLKGNQMNITNSWYLVNKAIGEADRLKQKSIYEMQYTDYMVVRDEDNYVVQMFNYPARDQAIKNGSLLYITR
jgi:hypothetical protein